MGPIGLDGGIPALGVLLLESLLAEEVTVDVFQGEGPVAVAERLSRAGARVIRVGLPWSCKRWYSRGYAGVLVSHSLARALTVLRVNSRLVREHRRRRYDCVLRYSQPESFLSAGQRRQLPAVVVHPCTHAAGELRWQRRERDLARGTESLADRALARLLLEVRSRGQARDLRRAQMVIGPSERFVRCLREDYGVPAERLRVLRHPIDLQHFAGPRLSRPSESPLRLLYVARISARKGLEMVIELSRRLNDIAGEVEIHLVGGATMWSRYTQLLEGLNPRVAYRTRRVPFERTPRIYRDSEVLLVPSHYEPGSLSTGEALAAGLVVVASDAVGPTEVLSRECCRVFPAGDLDALKRIVRGLGAEMSRDGELLARAAVAEAERHFAPGRAGARLASLLAEARGLPR